jgi:hypothetical protein
VNNGLLVVPVEPLDWDLDFALEVLRLPEVDVSLLLDLDFLDFSPLPLSDFFFKLLTLPDGDVSLLDFLPLPLTDFFFELLTLPGPLPLLGVLPAGVGLGLPSVSFLLDFVFLPLPLTEVFVELLTLVFFGLLTLLPGSLPLPGRLPAGVGLRLTSVSLLLDFLPLPLTAVFVELLTLVFFGLLMLSGPLPLPGIDFFELLKLAAGVGLVLDLDFLPLPLTLPAPLLKLPLGSEFNALSLPLEMVADPLLGTLVPELVLLDTPDAGSDEGSSSSGSLRSVAEFVCSRKRLVGSCTTLRVLVLATTVGYLAVVATIPTMKDEKESFILIVELVFLFVCFAVSSREHIKE